MILVDVLEAVCVPPAELRPSVGSMTTIVASHVVEICSADDGDFLRWILLFHSSSCLQLLLAAFRRIAVLLNIDHVQSLEHVHLSHIDTVLLLLRLSLMLLTAGLNFVGLALAAVHDLHIDNLAAVISTVVLVERLAAHPLACLGGVEGNFAALSVVLF